MKSETTIFPRVGGGTVRIVMTEQITKPGTDMPSKRCSQCGRTRNVLHFLHAAFPCEDGYFEVYDDPRCSDCLPRSPIPIHTDERGKLRMRLRMRRENGEPVRCWDRKDHRWRSQKHFGLRRMTPGGNELRMQPYVNRSGPPKPRVQHRDARQPALFR